MQIFLNPTSKINMHHALYYYKFLSINIIDAKFIEKKNNPDISLLLKTPKNK
jgi:hypothetical protein